MKDELSDHMSTYSNSKSSGNRSHRTLIGQSDDPTSGSSLTRYTSPNSIDQQQHLNDKASTRRSSNSNSALLKEKELCHSSCWCNNLVEITCKYPTKVVKYVTLIDFNSCTFHEPNMSLFEPNFLKLSAVPHVLAQIEQSEAQNQLQQQQVSEPFALSTIAANASKI
jgi:hypothetical protein